MKAIATVALLVSSSVVPFAAQAQQSHPKAGKKRPPLSESAFQSQVLQKLSQMQTEIEDLRGQMAEKDAQIAALKRSSESSSGAQAQTAAQVDALATSTAQTSAGVSGLQTSVAAVRQQTSEVKNDVQQVAQEQVAIKKNVDEPVSIHYKGVTITPGGFLAGESIWRQRALNADVYTNFNGTPYGGAGEAHTSEWVPSARATRPSVLITGKVPFGTLSGFFEGDFLSAGSTSNNLQSNSYTLRVRQAWGQAAFGRYKFTGGQMWTLLSESKKAADPGQEALPLIFDGNLHVGYTYVRQPGFRFQAALSPKTTLAVALEASQYQFSASNASPNFFFGNAGAAPGLNNPGITYTNQVAPDVVVKAAFDPGYGHYEIGGVVRLFRDRYYPAGTTAANAQNDTRVGGGFVASARFPISKLDLGLHLVAGDGTGRYGASILPDVTVRPDGTLSPLRNAQGLLSLEYHATKKLDLFGYAGTEYVQRTFYRSATGTLVGYAPPSANNTGCNTEAVPTGSTGYLPGTGTCLGATRDLVQGSVGWVYRFYSGPAGKLQYGAAYSYLSRSGWVGTGGAPTATNNLVYTSFRYFLP
ncbi:hypothetical protein [Terriglobus roseus]|uniref:Uncharacterized protein n=1 Tax=Terriglobus roseus TaxID=392734 RepID=A0A1H4JB98_9BACT|nr:hypothetical protein [Terriglobus roseus]SEB43315.1 hypothetical protein SAMN05443244_0485 [Terriglobus roseus]